MCVCVCVCVSEWLGLTPRGERVRATLSHVCRRWTFKACMETVKRTYWLQALTLCTQWLPIFHPPWDIVVALCVCLCVYRWCPPAPSTPPPLTVLSDMSNMCLHTSPGRMDTSTHKSDTGGQRRREIRMHSAPRTAAARHLVCFPSSGDESLEIGNDASKCHCGPFAFSVKALHGCCCFCCHPPATPLQKPSILLYEAVRMVWRQSLSVVTFLLKFLWIDSRSGSNTDPDIKKNVWSRSFIS